MKKTILVLACFFLSGPFLYPDYNLQPGPDWSMVWSDEFNGPGRDLNTNDWNYDTGFGDIPEIDSWGWGVGGLQDYTVSSSNVFVTNGNLVLRAYYTGGTMDGRNYSSGKIHTQNKRSFLYGIIAARIKMPAGKGTFPAFWMVGTNYSISKMNWPQCGEIDIVEMFDGGMTANAASHWYDEVAKTAPGTSASVFHETAPMDKKWFTDNYHVYELDWTKTVLRWKIDGKTVLMQPITPETVSELRQPMYLILNFGIGAWTEKVGHPDATAVFPLDMLVDWVRVYQKKESVD